MREYPFDIWIHILQSSTVSEILSTMTERVLLTDRQVQDFLINGYLALQPSSLNKTFHSSIFDQALSVFLNEGNPGNNILPRIPQLQSVFDDPVISGAIESLLGTNYTMQPHRHAHLTKPGTQDQQWHKDSYFGYRKSFRHHQLRYVMAMYYPQDTTMDMGPTAIKARTQYDTVDPKVYQDETEDQADENVYFTCKAGTVLLIHYDLVHRGTANQTKDAYRFMFKFQFNRLEDPKKPSWNHDPATDDYDAADAGVLQPIVKHVWNWLLGTTISNFDSPTDQNIGEWQRQLHDSDRRLRLNAAYNLALNNQYQILMDQLYRAKKNSSYEIVYALTACRHSKDAIMALRAALKEEQQHEYRASAIAFIFSEMGTVAIESLSLVIHLLNTTDSWVVKRYCCEALGTVQSDQQSDTDAAVRCLVSVLGDRESDIDSKEPSHARFTAALSLAKLGPKAIAAIPVLKDALYLDENRYVNGNALLALERIGTNEALKITFQYLKTARWCEKTTPNSMY